MTANATTHQQVSAAEQKGMQDQSGWGLAGLALGILIGFAVSFYFIVPLFPKDRTTLTITLLTTIVTVMMSVGGALGYLAARKKTARAGQA